MTSFSPAQVFAAAFVAELLRAKVFNLTAVFKTISGQDQNNEKGPGGIAQFKEMLETHKKSVDGMIQNRQKAPGAKPDATQTQLDALPEFQALKAQNDKIAAMEEESKTLNAPETFAKYGKLQRQLLKEGKEQKRLEALAAEAKKNFVPPQPIEAEVVVQEEEQKVQPAQGEILYANKFEIKATTLIDRLKSPRIIGTLLFFIIAYMVPLMFIKYFVSHEFMLMLPVQTIHPDEMWPIGDWIFKDFPLDGQIYTFVSFRLVYIISLKFADTLISLVDKVITDFKGDGKLNSDTKLKKD